MAAKSSGIDIEENYVTVTLCISSPGNRHCAAFIGTLSFRIDLRSTTALSRFETAMTDTESDSIEASGRLSSTAIHYWSIE